MKKCYCFTIVPKLKIFFIFFFFFVVIIVYVPYDHQTCLL